MDPLGSIGAGTLDPDMLRGTSLPPKAGRSTNETELRAKAQEFEAVMIAQLLKPMFETVQVDELTGGGFGEEMTRSLLVEEYGRTIAEAGGLGMSDAIMRALVAAQGLPTDAPADNASPHDPASPSQKETMP